MKSRTIEVAVEYNGLTLYVSGVYTPAEHEVRYYSDGSGYPGCSSELDVTSIYYNEWNLTSVIPSDEIDEITELAIQKEEE